MKSAKNILNIVFCLCAFAAMLLAAAPLEAQAAVSVVNSSVTGEFSNAGTIAAAIFLHNRKRSESCRLCRSFDLFNYRRSRNFATRGGGNFR